MQLGLIQGVAPLDQRLEQTLLGAKMMEQSWFRDARVVGDGRGRGSPEAVFAEMSRGRGEDLLSGLLPSDIGL